MSKENNMAEESKPEKTQEEALIEDIGATISKLQELCTQAADKGIVISIDQAAVDVHGISKPVFVFRGAFKRLLQPSILRL
jgi:hypothetical protein